MRYKLKHDRKMYLPEEENYNERMQVGLSWHVDVL
jgi:hypothetical protein